MGEGFQKKRGGGWRRGGGGVEKDLARLKGKGGRFQAVLTPKVLCLLWGHNRISY